VIRRAATRAPTACSSSRARASSTSRRSRRENLAQSNERSGRRDQPQGGVMAGDKSVLVIGLDPTLIDFSQPGYMPGMTASKVLAGLKSCEEELTGLGYSVEMCMTDFGETAEAVVE